MPRNYSMEKRVAAVEETRNRIIEATVELHDQQGVIATTMQEIAARAGVALGTVYRHFPSLDELVPACGGRILELNPPPAPDAFDSLASPQERYGALSAALFAFYERGERRFEVGFAESLSLPVMARLMNEIRTQIAQLVGFALENTPEDVVRLGIALSDFRTWQAFKQAGLSNEAAMAVVAETLAQRIARGPEGGGGK